ncbi:hypothetical protein J2R80_004892 [Bradyrhizobium sp. USDA 4541]|nr:hypothetical protein [Bradyrhizobium sp. USDA 4541]
MVAIQTDRASVRRAPKLRVLMMFPPFIGADHAQNHTGDEIRQ